MIRFLLKIDHKKTIAMKKYLFASLLALLVHPAVAQEAAEKHKVGIAIQPQSLFMHGLRVDIQPYVSERNQLVFAPQFYYSNGGDWIFNTGSSDVVRPNVDFEKLRGFGLEFNYRIYPAGIGAPLYAAFGIGYNFFRPTYSVSNHILFEENRWSVSNYQKINRVKLILLMGCQIPTKYGFFFDPYWGVSFRQGTADKPRPDNVEFIRGMWNMAYQGFSLELGVKVGLDL